MPRMNSGYEFQHAFDKFANALTVITEPHRMCHDGFMFHSSGKTTGVANAASVDFLMSVPAGCFPHVQRVRLDLEDGDIDLQMYENVVTSADGTPVTIINTNRNSALTASGVVTTAPTVTNIGDLFHTHWVPPTATGVGTSIGVMDINAFGEEWVLKPSTKYLFRITNNSGGTIDFRWEVAWYEIGED